ncbi:MAG: MvdC/MvdD family ATP grasp protein [Pseudonocardiaceae bacterium]
MSLNHKILLIAESDDSETELVAETLTRHAVETCWIDTADFPSRLGLVATPGESHPGRLFSVNREIDLSMVRSVYRRSPAVFRLADDMSAPERRFALMEAIQGLGGVLAALECRWINHPSRVADASYKPIQLCIAAQCGLRPPRTLVTNVGSAAQDFTCELGGTAIYKPMSPGVLSEQGAMRVINANLISSESIDCAAVERTAHTFQQWIDKEFDARVTVVGDHCFGVAIHAKNELTRVDWRADYGALSYSTIEVPVDVQAGVRRYLSRFDLLFAAFDFSVAQDGAWWFLEANPNGLWAWLEEAVGIPVAATIAELLAKEIT